MDERRSRQYPLAGLRHLHVRPARRLTARSRRGVGLLTWDEQGAEQNHRELDIEISQWGDRTISNAHMLSSRTMLPANVVRFAAPPGLLTHTFRWEPGRALFRTVQGAALSARGRVVAEHEFTAGVPIPGPRKFG